MPTTTQSSTRRWQALQARVYLSKPVRDALNAYRRKAGLANASEAVEKLLQSTEQPK